MHTAPAPPLHPDTHRILRLPEVIARTGLRRDSVYRLARAGRFPKPIKISQRATGWLSQEIDEFVAGRAAGRDQAQSVK
jgi:prophage regulatory protein